MSGDVLVGRKSVAAVVVILGAVLPYLNCLTNEFVWADRPLIVQDYHLRSPRHTGAIFTRDFWVIPLRDDIACVAWMGDGLADELSVMGDDGGDYAFYLWNAPLPGDWTYWDAASRNPSPFARDLWQVPAGNNTVDMAAPGPFLPI